MPSPRSATTTWPGINAPPTPNATPWPPVPNKGRQAREARRPARTRQLLCGRRYLVDRSSHCPDAEVAWAVPAGGGGGTWKERGAVRLRRQCGMRVNRRAASAARHQHHVPGRPRPPAGHRRSHAPFVGGGWPSTVVSGLRVGVTIPRDAPGLSGRLPGGEEMTGRTHRLRLFFGGCAPDGRCAHRRAGGVRTRK